MVFAFRIIAVALLVLASGWSLRLGWADILAAGDASDLRRAIHLAPGNAEYYARWSGFHQDDAEQYARALRSALQLNPRISSAWIALGLQAERHGEFKRAERLLLKAAELDRTWIPRWTLANYYYRRNDKPHLLEWTTRALEIADVRSIDPDPLFELCEPPLSAPRQVLTRYLAFLLARNRLDEAAPVSEAVLSEADLSLLLKYCDRLLETGAEDRALRVWNALCRRGRIPYRELDGSSLTNGDFFNPPLEHGFDWRTAFVSSRRPGDLRIEFDGEQPENCDVLTQKIPVLANRRYTLRFRYRTDYIPPDSGLHWQVNEPSADLSSDRETEGSFDFSTSARLITLKLSYHRPPGKVRLRGAILLRYVALFR